jgi:hypothetical protein
MTEITFFREKYGTRGNICFGFFRWALPGGFYPWIGKKWFDPTRAGTMGAMRNGNRTTV